jgi:multiple sugar transport system substrate-binding protein
LNCIPNKSSNQILSVQHLTLFLEEKMKHSLLLKVVSLFVVASFILAACGTPAAPATEAPIQPEAPKATEAPAQPAATEAPATAAEVTLRWRTRPDNKEEIAVYTDISKALDTQLEGITLAYEPGGTEGAKSGADSGALWGLPRDVSTFVLYLNMDLINEAGAPDPRELAKEGKWDWAAFADVATKTRALGSDIYGYGASAWWGPYGVWLNAAGGGFYNADRTACALDTAESLKGLEFQRSLYQDLKVATPYGEDPEPPFRAGKVAMFQNGRWATPGVRTVPFNWDVVELPNGPSGTPGNWLFWGAYVVNAKTAHPEEAWKLVQALTTAETQGKVAALGANIPSRVSKEALDAFVTFTPPANNQAFLNGIADAAKPTAEGPLWAGSWPEYDKIMGPAIQAVLTGGKTVDEFGATICDEANKVFTK